MGRLGYEATITHFSHIHPLDLASLDQSPTPPTCAGCTLRASGYAYSCRTCGYVLHISCAQLPQLIRHPADSLHALPLLPVPAYPEGSFGCDACGRDGTGFSYHCADCGFDLHALCASMPLSVHPQAAHPHALSLVFVPPYENKGFSCDLCGGMGGNHWLYRCSVCEFDVHLGCASSAAEQSTQEQQQVQAIAGHPAGAMGVGNRGCLQAGPAAVGVLRMLNRGGSGSGHGGWQGGGAPAALGVRQLHGGAAPNNGSMVNQAINKLVNNAAQQMGQNFVQSVFGGGGGADSGGGGDGGGDSSGSVFGEVGSGIGDAFGGSDS